MPQKNIVWLASYPKSGNTWARIFLANYLLNAQQPVPINQVHRIGIGDSVADPYRKVNGGRYDPMDTMGHLKQRGVFLGALSRNGADLNFVKTHNQNGKAFGVKLIDPALTRAAVYFVRNPLDVVISFARHYGLTPSQACINIASKDNSTSADAANVIQYLGTWSDHVRGWTRTKAFPVHVMRYEDMHADPKGAFSALLKFLKVPLDDDRLDRAIRFSSFDEVSKQEKTHGFIERSQNAEKFFHSGTTGQWQDVLTDEDVARVKQDQAGMMKSFGYL